MDAEDIIDATAERAQLESRTDAERVVLATLTTLGEHVSAGEAQQLAAALPGEIGDAATSRSSASPDELDVEEFTRRVASREGIDADPSEAESHVRAVATTLSEAGVGDELRDARAQLPDEFGSLLATDDRSE